MLNIKSTSIFKFILRAKDSGKLHFSGSFANHNEYFNSFMHLTSQNFRQNAFFGQFCQTSKALQLFCLFFMPKFEQITLWGSFGNHRQYSNVFCNALGQNCGKINFFVQFCQISAALHCFRLHHSSNSGQVNSFGVVLPNINYTSICLFTLRTKNLGKLHFWSCFAKHQQYLRFFC